MIDLHHQDPEISRLMMDRGSKTALPGIVMMSGVVMIEETVVLREMIAKVAVEWMIDFLPMKSGVERAVMIVHRRRGMTKHVPMKMVGQLFATSYNATPWHRKCLFGLCLDCRYLCCAARIRFE